MEERLELQTEMALVSTPEAEHHGELRTAMVEKLEAWDMADTSLQRRLLLAAAAEVAPQLLPWTAECSEERMLP